MSTETNDVASLDGYMILEWSTERLRASGMLPLNFLDDYLTRYPFDCHMEAFTFYVPAGASHAEVEQYVECYLGAL